MVQHAKGIFKKNNCNLIAYLTYQNHNAVVENSLLSTKSIEGSSTGPYCFCLVHIQNVFRKVSKNNHEKYEFIAGILKSQVGIDDKL